MQMNSHNTRPPHRGRGTAACWVLFSVLSVIGMFFFLIYHTHLQMGFENEATSVKDFVTNKLAALPLEVPERIVSIEKELEDTIAKDASWIGEERKEIHDYLLRLNEANKHAFQKHTVLHNPPSVDSIPPAVGGPVVPLEPELSAVKPEPAIVAPPVNKIELISSTSRPVLDGPVRPLVSNAIPEDELERMNCPDGSLVSYWHKTTQQDLDYVSPYAVAPKKNKIFRLREKYVTFEPDVGGWNNIRMQMEVVLVFAAATGRTLVIPPEQAMYLLDKGKGTENAHSFEDYFPFDKIRKVLKVISMEEFLKREAITGHLVAFNDSNLVMYPPKNQTVVNAMNRPRKRAMWAYLRSVAYCPKWKPFTDYVVFAPRPGLNVSLLPNASIYAAAREKFSSKRTPIYYNSFMQDTPLIHFISLPQDGYRLLTHFYTFLHFEDPFMERYYRRFIRDYIRYVDEIFCKGAVIVREMLAASGGRYAAFHIRRGELQYKEVKLPAIDILKNTANNISSDITVAYVATDERNKSFFDAFHDRFEKVYYLDDFFDKLNLADVNPNFLGMIDQVACTQGEVFVGTWFSTFTGYITRLRGYLGHLESSNFFGDKNHRDRYQKYEIPKFPFYMREWQEAFLNINEE